MVLDSAATNQLAAFIFAVFLSFKPIHHQGGDMSRRIQPVTRQEMKMPEAIGRPVDLEAWIFNSGVSPDSDESINSKVLTKGHEYLRLDIYPCPAKHPTLGWGRNLDARPLSAREIQLILAAKPSGVRDWDAIAKKVVSTKPVLEAIDAEIILELDLSEAFLFLSTRYHKWWGNLNAARKAALVDMYHNMGAGGFTSFEKASIPLISKGMYKTAGKLMRMSKYARKDVPTRAKRIIQILETGEMPSAAEFPGWSYQALSTFDKKASRA